LLVSLAPLRQFQEPVIPTLPNIEQQSDSWHCQLSAKPMPEYWFSLSVFDPSLSEKRLDGKPRLTTLVVEAMKWHDLSSAPLFLARHLGRYRHLSNS
jgi:hypothetical protein